MKVGIIVAMDKELRQLKQLFEGMDVMVQKCGIGKVNAALGAQRMISEFHPDVIISSGCAGGNGDDINVQDVIVSSELLVAAKSIEFELWGEGACRTDCHGRLVCGFS